MCSILSEHSSFLQWCYWTPQYCCTLLVGIFILTALGVVSFPFYSWRNRGTENLSDFSRVCQLPSWCPVWPVVSCLGHQCKLCLWLSSLQPWKRFPYHLPTHPENVMLNPTCWLNSSGKCGSCSCSFALAKLAAGEVLAVVWPVVWGSSGCWQSAGGSGDPRGGEPEPGLAIAAGSVRCVKPAYVSCRSFSVFPDQLLSSGRRGGKLLPSLCTLRHRKSDWERGGGKQRDKG